ncbi:general stress protein [Paenibacillus sp. JX-17]|uniref:General stress protein n=1 Tax=Paenibacillus lacisoli TaxID=3064525 RepID=A0ABT9CA06_9BACL|nr:general stress protein [Paenibacillus sp. JX-17]MDO7905710.1 general stress protein [Paenibacillus sp. JX-17]
MEKKIVGVFDTEQEASRAIESLQQQGFRNDEISVITRDKEDMRTINEETGTKAPEGVATGAATGGVLGGVAGLLAGIGALAIPGIGPILAAGPIAATLTGAAVGAGAGGLVGGLVGLGIPEDEAKEYEGYVDQGKILVLVDAAADRGNDVYDVFRTNRSLNADRYAAHSGVMTDDLARTNRLDEDVNHSRRTDAVVEDVMPDTLDNNRPMRR